MIIIPLLDDDMSKHDANMVVQIDLQGHVAKLVDKGQVLMSVRLRQNDKGYIEPTDPMVAKNPGSAFEHTVNVWCNTYNQGLQNQNKATMQDYWNNKLQSPTVN